MSDAIEDVRHRVRTGMRPESAIGLEWRLMRAREGFDGNTWSASNGKASPRTIRSRIEILKYISEGEKNSSEIIANAKASNISNNLVALTNLGLIRVAKRISHNCKVYEITQEGHDWMVDNDTHSSLF